MLVRTPHFDRDVWLVPDPHQAGPIRKLEEKRKSPRPVLDAQGIADLEGESGRVIRSVLAIFTAFPGSRLQ